MSDSVRPHRRQPIRLRRPWDSPGKNTGVGCHFFLQCMKVKSEREVAQSCPTQEPHGLQPTRLLHPWDFPGKTTGVGCRCLLQVYKTTTHFCVLILCAKILLSSCISSSCLFVDAFGILGNHVSHVICKQSFTSLFSI